MNTIKTNKNASTEKAGKQRKFFSILWFFEDNGTYHYTGKTDFADGTTALYVYVNTPCPASALISEETLEEYEAKVKETIDNYTNPKWTRKHLVPYI